MAIGIIETRWWRSDNTAHLMDLFHRVEAATALERPLILRGRVGAVELIGTGVLVAAVVALVPLVRRGRRTAALWLSGGVLVFMLVQIAGDLAVSSNIDQYLFLLANNTAVPGATAADIVPLLPPGWYSWVEDISQGAAAAMVAVLVIALARLTIPMSRPMTAGRSEPTDAYGQALRRIADGRSVE
jgi:hypothetical protein